MFLKAGLVTELETQHQQDREQRTKADRPSKKRDHLRAICRDWLISGGDSIVVPSREEMELDTDYNNTNNTDLEAQGQIDEEMLQVSVHAIRPNDSWARAILVLGGRLM